jgi:hypothetical protein
MLALQPQVARAADDGPGEFSIPAVIPLGPGGIEKLRQLARDDAEAKALADDISATAKPLLDAQPHPLEVIEYEGLVHTDPRRLATVAKLREMADAACLMRWWQISGDPRAAETLRRFITAWAETYRPTGNDVNENKLYPLLVAYSGLRSSMPAAEVAKADSWVQRLGEGHKKGVEKAQELTNRYTKRLRLLAICGTILDQKEWGDEAQEGLRRFVTQSLRPDGSSVDLEKRDTLTYHNSALVPAIEVIMLAGHAGPGLYDWTSPKGGSIRKSVDFVVPYATGVQTREEWRNSKVDLDRRRAAAGLEQYRPGRLYDPKHALPLMEAASAFDPDLVKVVRSLSESKAERFPTWQMLMNQAAIQP